MVEANPLKTEYPSGSLHPEGSTMNTEKVKDEIGTNVYHITADSKVPLHKHRKHDELFYCLKGSGFGVREEGEGELSVGQCFVARAGTMHSL